MTKVPGKVWMLLLAGPLLFLLVILGVSGAFGLQGVPAEAIGVRTAGQASLILFLVLAALGLLVWRLVPLADHWATLRSNDLVIGAAVGGMIAAGYFLWLSPAMVWLQGNLGDYVPPGAVLPSVSANIALFFLANVVLAPAVEETLYRGFALQALRRRFGVAAAVALSCAFFGLLHWTGGVWYMLLTGGVAGGLFCALAVWRKGLAAPFAAHLALNSIEFVVAVQS